MLSPSLRLFIYHDFLLSHNTVYHRLTCTLYPPATLQLSSLSPRCRMLSPPYIYLLADISVSEYSDAYSSCTDIIPSHLTHSPFLPSTHHLRDVAGIGLVDELRWELWRTTRCHLSSHGSSFLTVYVSCSSASVSMFLCCALPLSLYFYLHCIFLSL